MHSKLSEKPNTNWQRILNKIIFEADTRSGRWFDILLILFIIVSVLVVMLDSVSTVRSKYGSVLYDLEWSFTILFSIEYLLRLVSVRRPLKYATSFFGVIDFLAIVPTYLSALLPGSQYFLVIRVMRVLRIFRVLKLVQYLQEAHLLIRALNASRRKITVFIFTVFTLVVVLGSLMYVIEGEEHGFTSIPRSIYWSIVTLTTVGYGDISPKTSTGQALAAIIMILGYSIIAVPTGIVSVEMAQLSTKSNPIAVCSVCHKKGHDSDASFCKYCGSNLKSE